MSEEETTSVPPRHTQHELNLLTGKVLPRTPEEFEYIQMHANDIIPKEKDKQKNKMGEIPNFDQLPPQGIETEELKEVNPRVEAWQRSIDPGDFKNTE